MKKIITPYKYNVCNFCDFLNSTVCIGCKNKYNYINPVYKKVEKTKYVSSLYLYH